MYYHREIVEGITSERLVTYLKIFHLRGTQAEYPLDCYYFASQLDNLFESRNGTRKRSDGCS
jgi:hypothetical protein